MFSSNVFRRLTSQPIKSLFLTGAKTCTTDFGDRRMPDKLYKNIELEVSGSEKAVMASYVQFILMAAGHLNIKVGEVREQQRPELERLTVLKSVFVHKKHMVQYEVRTHYKWVNLQKLTGSTADTFLEYVERMLPEGVALKVTKTAIEPMPKHINYENVKASAESVEA